MPHLASPVFVAARPLARRTLIALGVPTAALCVAIAVKPAPVTVALPAGISLPAAEDIAGAAETQTAPDHGSVVSREISLVFAAPGGLYMKLADVAPESMPAHAAPVHYPAGENHWVETSVAQLAPGAIPARYASWVGRSVVVDGTCQATVTRISLAGRLVGDPGYAADVAAWTGDTVLAHGNPMLVAELAGCTTGTTARAATHATPVVMVTLPDARLAAKGKKALLRSRAAARAQAEWTSPDYGFEGDSARTKTWWTSEETTWDVKVMRHPTSGATFVSVHAQQAFACGGPEIDVWGLYRVEDDGELAALDATLGDIRTIESFIDVDHDGTPEVIGQPLLGGRLVNDAHGTTLSKLDEAFYGCPC